MISSSWTDTELKETLYQIDPAAFGIIQDIKQTKIQLDIPKSTNLTVANQTDAEDSADYFEPVYLSLELEEAQVQIVEFYAPWCPHCQHYKPHYIKLAQEMQRRVIVTDISFHAVSCTLNEDLCETYEISGYPTVMGWKGGDNALYNNITQPGLILNPGGDITADSVAEDLDIALAQEEIKDQEPESQFSNSQDRRILEEKKKQYGLEVAKEHTSQMELDSDINERYHNAAVSLAYLLKTGVYESRGTLNPTKARVLYDFLQLMDWATPLEWNIRTMLVQRLLNQFDSQVVQGKKRLNELVEQVQGRNFKTGRRLEELLWGHINENRSRRPYRTRRNVIKGSRLGGESVSLEVDLSFEAVLKDNSQWTEACTHNTAFKGYTCGLWDLFHILTIGSTQERNKLYGIQHGYLISSRHVALTIRNFIAYFFRCDVCKTNFLNMYDNCGHDHCKRLHDEQIHITNVAEGEIVIWLWEVHNAVTRRIMKEAADRDHRVLSKEEEIASKFPSRKMCRRCWLDRGQESWDSQEIITFLKGWYWPIGTSNISILHRNMNSLDQKDGTPLSWTGFYFIMIPILYLMYHFGKEYIQIKSNANIRWKQNKSK